MTDPITAAREEGFRSGLRTAAHWMPACDSMLGTDTADFLTEVILDLTPVHDPGEEKVPSMYAGGQAHPAREHTGDDRLAAIADGRAVEEAYAAFPHPLETFHGDLRSILRRAAFSAEKVRQLEIEIEDRMELERRSSKLL